MKKPTSLLSPIGDIRFMAVALPVNKYKSDEKIFTIRLEIDGTSVEGLKFKNTVSEINEKKIVTNGVSKPGNFIVTFSSKFAPKVFDGNGTILEGREIPFFTSTTDSGQARVEAKVYTGGMNGTLTLQNVQLKNLTLAPREHTEQTVGLLEQAIAKETDKLNAKTAK